MIHFIEIVSTHANNIHLFQLMCSFESSFLFIIINSIVEHFQREKAGENAIIETFVLFEKKFIENSNHFVKQLFIQNLSSYRRHNYAISTITLLYYYSIE